MSPHIDAHQHYWEVARGDYDWMDPNDAVLARRYMPADLAPSLETHGIARSDAQRLYLTYHEGRGGYRRGTWKKKPQVQRTARRVAATAAQYRAQLARCESRFRCDSWYQVWPLCR